MADGDDIALNITGNVQGNEGKVSSKGRVEGDTVKFRVDVPATGQTIEMAAKRTP